MKRLLIILFCVFLCAAPSGCAGKGQYTDYEYECFDTVTSFTAYGVGREDFDRFKDYAFSELKRYDALFDIFEKHDGVYGLYDLNRDEKRTEGVEVPSEIYDLLEECVNAYDLTDGRVDCTLGTVLSKWRDARETLTLPDMEELKRLNEYNGIDNLILSDGKVRFANDVMQLDVGAVAKGYACEKIAEGLKSLDCKAFILSAGGNVVTCGEKDYKIGVRGSDGVSVSVVLLTHNEAVVTSGGYYRAAEIDGKVYHHIIDPQTLMPAEKVKSATVVSPSSALADALSTYLFQLEADEAFKAAEKLGVQCVIEDASGNILCSPGLKYKK
ncbi:MAG: FAD:protein FMN transferase [Clostridia bacterium]|nr:FAD:protein FMN transferase [Clostridia bacterium]